jgi:hypothetical protein
MRDFHHASLPENTTDEQEKKAISAVACGLMIFVVAVDQRTIILPSLRADR